MPADIIIPPPVVVRYMNNYENLKRLVIDDIIEAGYKPVEGKEGMKYLSKGYVKAVPVQ